MIKNIKNIKFKQGNKIYNVRVMLGTDSIYLFENSLPQGIVPKVGDKILCDLKNDFLEVKEVEPITIQNSEWSNYALKVNFSE